MKRFTILYFFLIASHFSFSQSWMWGSSCNGDAGVLSVASDSRGNCYSAGLFQNDTLHFGTYTLMNSTVTNYPYSSDEDAFLVKYDPQGNVLWAKQTKEKNTNASLVTFSPVSVCADGSGNTYLSGNYPDTRRRPPSMPE